MRIVRILLLTLLALTMLGCGSKSTVHDLIVGLWEREDHEEKLSFARDGTCLRIKGNKQHPRRYKLGEDRVLEFSDPGGHVLERFQYKLTSTDLVLTDDDGRLVFYERK